MGELARPGWPAALRDLGTRRKAETREREIRDLRERGRFDKIDAGTESLREATERWWTDHVDVRVTSKTANVYATCLDRYLMPRLGAMPIRDIAPAHVIELQRGLREDGVGDAMAQKIVVVLSGHAPQPTARAHRAKPRPARADPPAEAQAGDTPSGPRPAS